MDTKNITLKVNSDLYDNYREYCKKKGLIVSRQFEIMIEKQLREGAKSQWQNHLMINSQNYWKKIYDL